MSTEKTSLPADVEARIAADFAREALDRVRAALGAYQDVERVRVIRCIVHLARGNMDQLLGLVATAQADRRDIIYWAEYDGSRRVRDLNLPFA